MLIGRADARLVQIQAEKHKHRASVVHAVELPLLVARGKRNDRRVFVHLRTGHLIDIIAVRPVRIVAEILCTLHTPLMRGRSCRTALK